MYRKVYSFSRNTEHQYSRKFVYRFDFRKMETHLMCTVYIQLRDSHTERIQYVIQFA